MNLDMIAQFRNEMEKYGLSIDTIIADGILHRFHVNGDKHSTRNGWYVLYLDRLSSGAFGSWKTGIAHKWCSKSRGRMTVNEWAQHCHKMERIRRQRDQEKAQEQQKASKRAYQIWSTASPADPQHPYLLKKLISPFIARQRGSLLVLPVIDFDEHIWSLQFIDCDGSKKLLIGGAKKSHFIPINQQFDASSLLICEGYATGASLALAYPEACVIAAIDAGNLASVATLARSYRPNAEILICADDDRKTIGNPGLTKAKHAAMAAGASYTTPKWPKNAPNSLTDFNDLVCWLYANKKAATWKI